MAAVDIYSKLSPWVVSPEINNTAAAIVTTTSNLILKIPCVNVSLLAIAVRNNGPNALTGFAVRAKMHALSPEAQSAQIASSAEMVSSTVGVSRNATLVNNITLPIRYCTSDPGVLAV